MRRGGISVQSRPSAALEARKLCSARELNVPQTGSDCSVISPGAPFPQNSGERASAATEICQAREKKPACHAAAPAEPKPDRSHMEPALPHGLSIPATKTAHVFGGRVAAVSIQGAMRM